MFVISGLEKGFAGLPVLDRIDLEFGEDDILALAGPSGCGKTTLLDLIGGLLAPDAGRIELGGVRIGRVFQEDRLLPWLTLEENVAAAGGAGGRKAAADLIARVGLAGFERSFPAALSGGMRQRAALARALHFPCGLLLLDEPFKSLDPGLRGEMLDLLLAVRRERRLPALFVTHDLDEALAAATRLAILGPRPARVAGRFDLGEVDRRRPADRRELAAVKREALELLGAPGGGTLPAGPRSNRAHLTFVIRILLVIAEWIPDKVV
ncbi:MAG: ABC transporter ATP-binding protein [Planctomycetota bacterium]|jgi:NitT/TauT family transport system ATP-binding protein|nr:ABC transporter ATP-binding protein [Planctomycetota bacterium]